MGSGSPWEGRWARRGEEDPLQGTLLAEEVSSALRDPDSGAG